MVRDQSLRRGEHLLVGGDEPCRRLGVVTERPEDRVAHEAEERVDRTVGDVTHGRVGRPGEGEQLGEREAGVEEDESRTHRFRVGRRVAGDTGVVDVMRQEQTGARDRGEQCDARTDLLSQRREVEGRLEVVGRCADGGGQRRVRGGESFAVGVHATEGRPLPVGSLCPMSDTSLPTPGTGEVLPAAGRDGKDAVLVQAMFDRVAPRYDLANTVLSLGQDAHWRRVTAAAARPAGAHVLDVAAGPGNVAVELVRQGAEQVTALDLSFNMLWEGARRGHVGIAWVNGDALALPFSDATFDAVTISFGLRNVPDPEAALAEFARVTRPGGRIVVCEFADPTWRPFREVYRRYLVGALPRVARVVSSSASAYEYLAESILAWPDRRTLAGWIEAAGYDGVRVRDLSGGIVAVHRADRMP